MLESLIKGLAISYEMENQKNYDNIVDAMIGSYEAGFKECLRIKQKEINELKEQLKKQAV